MKGKGTAALIVAALGAKKHPMHDKEEDTEDSSESSEGDMSEAKTAAAEEMMAALKSNDTAAFSEALESFIECCEGMG